MISHHGSSFNIRRKWKSLFESTKQSVKHEAQQNQTSQDQRLCSLCKQVDLPSLFAAAKTSNEHPIHQWPLTALFENNKSCTLCHLIVKLIRSSDPVFPETPRSDITCALYLVDHGMVWSDASFGDAHTEHGTNMDARQRRDVPRLAISLKRENERSPMLAHGLQLKTEDRGSKQSNLLRGRAVGTIVDMEMVTVWINRCAHDHHQLCTPLLRDSAARMRVIDTVDMCIRELGSGAGYVVLSYVWGSNEQLRLLQENQMDMSKVGGIIRSSIPLPRTVADAISLTKTLGKRYLWVDALCIVQDDLDDLATQIKQMNMIYSCAELTVVAAAGVDSNAGLHGLQEGSRQHLDLAGEVQGLSLISSAPNFTAAISESQWESRGWTMQEKVLSKRMIIFTEHQVFFHCNSATWCEDAIWENDDLQITLQPGWGTMSPALMHCALPSVKMKAMRKYAHLVAGYHNRQLTHQSDALNAFTGALTSLQVEMDTRFILGLPESNFTEGLLWISPVHDASLRRDQFPSWTWLGWKASALPGDVDFPPVDSTHIETISLVSWYSMTEMGKVEKIPDKCATSLDERPLPASDHASLMTNIPLSHCLYFWAQTAQIKVSCEPITSTFREGFTRYGSFVYHMYVDVEGEEVWLGKISLSKTWREQQSDKMEFIAISRRSKRSYYRRDEIDVGLDLMLVESQGVVSFRIQMSSTLVEEDLWQHARPTWRIVVLG